MSEYIKKYAQKWEICGSDVEGKRSGKSIQGFNYICKVLGLKLNEQYIVYTIVILYAC